MVYQYALLVQMVLAQCPNVVTACSLWLLAQGCSPLLVCSGFDSWFVRLTRTF